MHSTIEPLEARISPAALVGNVLTYTDIDGDLVKVTFTNAAMAAGDFSFSAGSVDGTTNSPQGLSYMNLGGKTGAGFTLTASPHLGKGDSHANIGIIDGLNTDLGVVVVDGDVSQIAAGSGAAGSVGLKSFQALSMNRLSAVGAICQLKNAASFTVKTDVTNIVLNFAGGIKTLSIGGNLEETVDGTLASIKVTGDAGSIKIGGSIIARSGGDRNLFIVGDAGTIAIGGSVRGGSANLVNVGQGQIEIRGATKSVTIGGDLAGSGAFGSGSLVTRDGLDVLKIGGSVIGGAGDDSGYIHIGNASKTISIGGSVLGGLAHSNSGYLEIFSATSVKIGGSVIGNSGDSGSGIVGVGEVGSFVIGHDFIGGNSTGASAVSYSGQLTFDTVGSLTIGGDFIGGRVLGAGSLDSGCSVINVTKTIGSLKIGGSILGDRNHLARITVGGGTVPDAVTVLQSLTVKGSVQSATILTGYSSFFDTFNPDAGIGSITIGGDFVGSLIHAGDSKGNDGIPGTADDDTLSLIATITSVKVGGAVTGLAGSPIQFGIHAPILLKATIGQATYDRLQLQGAVLFNSIGLAYVSSN